MHNSYKQLSTNTIIYFYVLCILFGHFTQFCIKRKNGKHKNFPFFPKFRKISLNY